LFGVDDVVEEAGPRGDHGSSLFLFAFSRHGKKLFEYSSRVTSSVRKIQHLKPLTVFSLSRYLLALADFLSVTLIQLLP